MRGIHMATNETGPDISTMLVHGLNALGLAGIIGLIRWAFGTHAQVEVLRSQMADIRQTVKDIHRDMPKRQRDPERYYDE